MEGGEEHSREPGVHDQIRAVNDDLIVDPEEHISAKHQEPQNQVLTMPKKSLSQSLIKIAYEELSAIWLIYDFGTNDVDVNVDEVEPTGAHSSGMTRMGWFFTKF